jgi:hypothetical protein
MVTGALLSGGAALPVVTGIAYVVRGGDGAAAAAIALAIVLANFALSGVISVLAGRRQPILSAFVGLPSYAIRMPLVLTTLVALDDRAFIDEPTFAAVFGAGVAGILAYEWSAWKRTPWLALTFLGSHAEEMKP